MTPEEWNRMTLEERFARMEDMLHMSAEAHVEFQIRQKERDAQIEKNAADIRDLLVASRKLLES
jgi:hypothetical protein